MNDTVKLFIRKIVATAIVCGFFGSYLWITVQDNIQVALVIQFLTLSLFGLLWINERYYESLYS